MMHDDLVKFFVWLFILVFLYIAFVIFVVHPLLIDGNCKSNLIRYYKKKKFEKACKNCRIPKGYRRIRIGEIIPKEHYIKEYSYQENCLKWKFQSFYTGDRNDSDLMGSNIFIIKKPNKQKHNIFLSIIKNWTERYY